MKDMGSVTTVMRAARAVLAELGQIIVPQTAWEMPDNSAHDLDAPSGISLTLSKEVTEVLVAGAALAVALFAVSILISWVLASRTRPNNPKAVFFAIFEDRIRGGFPSQSAECLSTVLMGVNSVLRPSPESPCVLLLVSEPQADDTSLRLARILAEVVQVVLRGWPSSSSDNLELRGQGFSSADDYWLLYETLSRKLGEQRVVIVHDVQTIHPRAAAAVAHVCDDAYPPFPQSVLLLLLNPGEHYPPDHGGGEAVVVAERCLVDCWLARGPPSPPPPAWASHDVLVSVLGRLTGRAVLVRPEPSLAT